MSSEHTFLAIYLGSMTGAKMTAWHALPEAERKAKEREGMAAWHGWVEKHKAVIVEASSQPAPGTSPGEPTPAAVPS